MVSIRVSIALCSLVFVWNVNILLLCVPAPPIGMVAI